MKEYKKTYWPLIAWCLAMVPAMLAVMPASELFGMGQRETMALMMAIIVLMLLLLFWMVWKGEYVYWINGGPSFEEAKAAGSEVRREYARKHLEVMFRGSAAAVVLLIAECVLGAHELVICLSASACIVAAVIPMIRIKWTRE